LYQRPAEAARTELGAAARDDEAVRGERRGWPYEPLDLLPPVEPGPPATEEAAFPPPPPPAPPALSRRALVVLSVASATLVLVAALGLADWWVRNREMETLLDRVERAERAQLPAIQGIGPLLLLCQQEAATDQAQLCDTVRIRQGAERALPALQQTGEAVAGTRLISFHGSLRTFRDRYVAHNQAWRTWLESLSRDPTAGGFGSPDAISTTFEAASVAADGALTPFPLHGNRDRVDTIFASVR
jgi:hypothetical protein